MPLPLSEAFELHRSYEIVMRNRSPKTEEAYSNTCKLLIRLFGDADLCQLTHEDIRRWHNWLLTWQKNDTARGNIVCLRMVLKFVARKGYKVVYYDEIIVPKKDKRRITYLEEDEVDEFILEAAKPKRGYARINRLRNVAIIKLLYSTGLRNSELCALNRDSIKNRSFTVIGKSRDPRIVFINSETEKAIEAYVCERSDSSKALFVSHQTGKRIRPDTVRKIFVFICNRSDFEGIHPHTIRHSYATLLLDKRVDIRYIGDLMGHADLNTTRIYTHYKNPQLKEIYDKAMN